MILSLMEANWCVSLQIHGFNKGGRYGRPYGAADASLNFEMDVMIKPRKGLFRMRASTTPSDTITRQTAGISPALRQVGRYVYSPAILRCNGEATVC